MRRSHVMMSVWQAVCGHQFVYESLGQTNQKIRQKHDGVTKSYDGVTTELRKVNGVTKSYDGVNFA